MAQGRTVGLGPYTQSETGAPGSREELVQGLSFGDPPELHTVVPFSVCALAFQKWKDVVRLCYQLTIICFILEVLGLDFLFLFILVH